MANENPSNPGQFRGGERRMTLELPGAASRRRSSARGSGHSILSPEILQEHNKSQFSINTKQEETVSRISSWMSGVKPNQPTSKNDAGATVPTPKTGWQAPGCSIDVPTGSGTKLDQAAEEVRERVARVQSLLITDEDDEIKPAPPGCGRYVPHAGDDTAFKPIEFTELHHLGVPGTMDSASTSSLTASRLSIGHEKLVSQMRRASSIAKQLQERRGSSCSRQRSFIEPTPSSTEQRRLSADTNVTTATEQTDASTGASTVATFKTTTTARGSMFAGAAPKLGIGTGVKLAKWTKRAQNAKTKGAQKFAVDENHFRLLKQTSEKIAVEIPLPLRIALHEELFPVICSTVKCYEKQLGKKHQLTKEAIDQRNNLARWGSVLTDL